MEFWIILFLTLQSCNWKITIFKYIRSWLQYSDGTCIRDYVHVNDLAYGHRKALEYIFNTDEGLYEVINLGSGVGFSIWNPTA